MKKGRRQKNVWGANKKQDVMLMETTWGILDARVQRGWGGCCTPPHLLEGH